MSAGLREGPLRWVRLQAPTDAPVDQRPRLHLTFDGRLTVCEAGIPEPRVEIELGDDALRGWPAICTDCRAVLKRALGFT